MDRQEKMNEICQNLIYILTYNFCSHIMQLHIGLIVSWTRHLVTHVVVYRATAWIHRITKIAIINVVGLDNNHIVIAK